MICIDQVQRGASGKRLGRVRLTLICSVPPSARADGKLAKVAEQVGKIGEYPKSKSTQPSP